ncbi:pectate lyase [Paenibacillus daejeonensis]|uniref:pectate lyase n=1 Tax=Paenibacillus daejeonensis TaxID=135193 RepID=UPI0003A5028D|nr:pectate lyase [Paenibacillus daejeonensis]
MKARSRMNKGLILLLAALLVLAAWVVSPGAAGAATLFTDNFNSGNASAWTATHGTWGIVSDGSPVYRKTGAAEGHSHAGQMSWANYRVSAKMKADSFGGARRIMLAARYQDGNNYYAASLYNSGGGRLEIRKKIGGTSTTLVQKNYALSEGTWYNVRLEVSGSQLRMFVNDTLQLEATDSSLSNGAIGLVAQDATTAKYDDIAVEDAIAVPGLNMDSFFTGYRDYSSFVTGNLSTDTTFAMNMISWQMPHGGFSKGISYASPWNGSASRSEWTAGGVELGMFDNDATVKELRFLADMYKKTNNTAMRNAVRNGVNFILTAQYPSGGWPQVYPKRNNYSDHVTYNDGAMVRVMVLVKDIVDQRPPFDNDVVTSAQRTQLSTALNKGVDYILNSQIKMGSTRTVWGQQHDPVTYEARAGRAYELPGKSGSESVGITALLMALPQTPQVREAAIGALAWYDHVRSNGVRYNRNGPVYFTADPNSVIWYRFYNLQDNTPFFADRDGQKYYDILQISEERRHGYQWAGNYGRQLLQHASQNGYYTLSAPLP